MTLHLLDNAAAGLGFEWLGRLNGRHPGRFSDLGTKMFSFTGCFFLNFFEAAGLGFEPRLSRPERDVLPLDDPAIKMVLKDITYK